MMASKVMTKKSDGLKFGDFAWWVSKHQDSLLQTGQPRLVYKAAKYTKSNSLSAVQPPIGYSLRTYTLHLTVDIFIIINIVLKNKYLKPITINYIY